MPKRSKTTKKTEQSSSSSKTQHHSRFRRWLAKRMFNRDRYQHVGDRDERTIAADNKKLSILGKGSSGDNGQDSVPVKQTTKAISVTSVQGLQTLRTNARCGFKDLTVSVTVVTKRHSYAKQDWSSEFRGYYSCTMHQLEAIGDTAILVKYQQDAAAAADIATPLRKFNLEAALPRPYHIRELLGIGSQGVVFHVSRSGQEYVAKLARRSVDIRPTMNEYSLIKDLRHANVVRGLGPLTGGFIMEKMSTDLSSVLRHDNPGSDLKLRIVTGVLTGLRYLHARGIAHLDIKPGNILMDKFSKPKIADFGLASRFRTAAGHQVVLHTFLGSIPYMAPELLAFNGDSSRGMMMPPLDMWASGCLVYRVLAGQRPFGTEDTVAAIRAGQVTMATRGLTVPPKVATQVRNNASASLMFTLTQKLLQTLPSQRPTAASLVKSYFKRH